MRTILENIQRVIASVDGIAYVADNWGQLDEYNPPVQFPCAIIDVDNVVYEEILEDHQQATPTFIVSIADLPPENVSITAPTTMKTAYYRVLEIVDEVYRRLRAFESDVHTPIVRLKTTHVRRDDRIKQYDIYLQCSYIEQLRVESQKTASANLHLTIN